MHNTLIAYQESTHPTLPELSAASITQTDLFGPQRLAQLKEVFYLFEKQLQKYLLN